MFCFWQLKTFLDNMKNILQISSLTNMKQMCYKENEVCLQKLIKCRL